MEKKPVVLTDQMKIAAWQMYFSGVPENEAYQRLDLPDRERAKDLDFTKD